MSVGTPQNKILQAKPFSVRMFPFSFVKHWEWERRGKRQNTGKIRLRLPDFVLQALTRFFCKRPEKIWKSFSFHQRQRVSAAVCSAACAGRAGKKDLTSSRGGREGSNTQVGPFSPIAKLSAPDARYAYLIIWVGKITFHVSKYFEGCGGKGVNSLNSGMWACFQGILCASVLTLSPYSFLAHASWP